MKKKLCFICLTSIIWLNPSTDSPILITTTRSFTKSTVDRFTKQPSYLEEACFFSSKGIYSYQI